MSAPARPAPKRLRTSPPYWYGLALFCLGHFFVDLYSGALGTLQPILWPARSCFRLR